MGTKKTLAVAASAFALAATAAIPATAGTAHHPATSKHGTFKGKITPSKGIKNGTKVTFKAKKGALKNTNYLCLFAITKGTNHGQDLTNTANVKSTSKGAVKCSLTFKSFKTTVGSATVSCPPTKKQAKAGYICGFAVADPADGGNKSNSFEHLHFK